MLLTDQEITVIDSTIKSVATAQADRFYKTDRNTPERSAIVAVAIVAQIKVALVDAGIDFNKVLFDIDPTDIILATLVEHGYQVFEVPVLDAGEDYKDIFGPIDVSECLEC